MFVDSISEIFKLIQSNEKLTENQYDKDITAEILLEISNSYKNSIDLRITWLESLALHHFKHKNYMEAALVHIQIASVIAQHLLNNRILTISPLSFTFLFPSCNLNLIPDTIEFPVGVPPFYNSLFPFLL